MYQFSLDSVWNLSLTGFNGNLAWQIMWLSSIIHPYRKYELWYKALWGSSTAMQSINRKHMASLFVSRLLCLFIYTGMGILNWQWVYWNSYYLKIFHIKMSNELEKRANFQRQYQWKLGIFQRLGIFFKWCISRSSISIAIPTHLRKSAFKHLRINLFSIRKTLVVPDSNCDQTKQRSWL